jgi:hypothetical protein
MDHYNKGDGIRNPWLDEDMQPLALGESGIDDVVAFLASLTSAQYQEQGVNRLPSYVDACVCTGRSYEKVTSEVRSLLSAKRPLL